MFYLLFTSIVWIFVSIIQIRYKKWVRIPEKYKNHEWTKDYIKESSYLNLLLGIWFFVCFLIDYFLHIPSITLFFLIVGGILILILQYKINKKYTRNQKR